MIARAAVLRSATRIATPLTDVTSGRRVPTSIVIALSGLPSRAMQTKSSPLRKLTTATPRNSRAMRASGALHASWNAA